MSLNESKSKLSLALDDHLQHHVQPYSPIASHRESFGFRLRKSLLIASLFLHVIVIFYYIGQELSVADETDPNTMLKSIKALVISNGYIWLHTVALVAILLEHLSLTRLYAIVCATNLAIFTFNLYTQKVQPQIYLGHITSIFLAWAFVLLLTWFWYDLARVEKQKRLTKQWITLI